jgi:hypothetical protein
MIELQDDSTLEEMEFEFGDIEQEDTGDSAEYSRSGRVPFERIPDGSKARGKGAESFPHPSDPLYAYYKSMSKIPLLTREQEVYLAKKIETAKLHVLRLLSLTPITSVKAIEMEDDLHPAGIPAAIPRFGAEDKREAENEASLEERSRTRRKLTHKIIVRLQALENRYRLARQRLQRYQSHNGNGHKDASRDAIFAVLQRISFTESQINELITSSENALHMMEQAQLEARTHSKRQKHEQRPSHNSH